MYPRRVVITGLSAITPLGRNLETTWTNLLAGKSGVRPITRFPVDAMATRIAGLVEDFDPTEYVSPKDARRMARFTVLSVAGARMVLKHAGWDIPDNDAERVGCILGTGMGELDILENLHLRLLSGGPRRISPFLIAAIPNMASGQMSIEVGAKGPNMAITSACASGLHGIGSACTEIALGRADAMITGGVEGNVSPVSIAGFNAARVLSTRNDTPEKASRPFDQSTDGFVLGEGGGFLLLESLEHARARGAKILAEIVGYGASADATHMTTPDMDGKGMAKAMARALKEAGVQPEEVGHINAYGLSAPNSDVSESRAIRSLFGEKSGTPSITANKSQMGHLLGGAGGVESVLTIMSLTTGQVPAILNLENPWDEFQLDYVMGGPRTQELEYVLCNGFGFGGTNASLLFKRFDG